MTNDELLLNILKYVLIGLASFLVTLAMILALIKFKLNKMKKEIMKDHDLTEEEFEKALVHMRRS